MARTLIDLSTSPKIRNTILDALDVIFTEYDEDGNPTGNWLPGRLVARNRLLNDIDYYVDPDAFWVKEKYGIRISDSWQDLAFDRKKAPTSSRYEFIFTGREKITRAIEEGDSRRIIFFNFRNWTKPRDNQPEAIILRRAREVSWERGPKEFKLDGATPV